MQLAPEEVLVNLSIEPAPGLSANQVIALVDRLEKRIREECPTVRQIFIETEALTRPSPDSQKKAATP
jgi:divalent metal cation (Fe/Co/Zn/Cd) transporter